MKSISFFVLHQMLLLFSISGQKSCFGLDLYIFLRWILGRGWIPRFIPKFCAKLWLNLTFLINVCCTTYFLLIMPIPKRVSSFLWVKGLLRYGLNHISLLLCTRWRKWRPQNMAQQKCYISASIDSKKNLLIVSDTGLSYLLESKMASKYF